MPGIHIHRYGLKVLREGVQDESNNYTRFLELSTEVLFSLF